MIQKYGPVFLHEFIYNSFALESRMKIKGNRFWKLVSFTVFTVTKCTNKNCEYLKIWILQFHSGVHISDNRNSIFLRHFNCHLALMFVSFDFYVSPFDVFTFLLLILQRLIGLWRTFTNLWSLLIPFNGTKELKWKDKLKQLHYYYLFSWEFVGFCIFYENICVCN